METAIQNKGLMARTGRIDGRIELDVPHKDEKITFIYPPSKLNYPIEVANEIHEAKLRFPLMDENASLFHSAWQNPEEEYSGKVIETLKQYLVLASNGLLYLPEKKGNEEVYNGVLIDDNFDVRKLADLRNNSEKLLEYEKSREKLLEYKKNLIAQLESKGSGVRFVPFGYPTGNIDSLSNHSLVIGLAGEEGAEKLDEIARKYISCSYVNFLNHVDIEDLRVPALYSIWSGDRLGLCGIFHVDESDGCAFGVQR